MTKQMENQFCIAATPRKGGEREDITGSMSEEKAILWRPSSMSKRFWKYFKVAKFPYYKEVNINN